MTPLLPAVTSGMPLLDTVYHCDALDLLRAMPDNSADLVWIDPPYGNSNGVNDLAAARARDQVKGGRQSGEIAIIANDDAESWQQLMPLVLREINRVLKPSGGCCCAMGGGGPNVLFAQLVLWIDTYMSFFHAVIWDKSKRGYGLGWRYRRNYEFVYVSHKRGGTLRWNDLRKAQPNVVRFAPTPNQYHPTQKPLNLVDFFIQNHTYPGDLIVDCFAGSGTTALAARNTGRHFIACDLSAEYVEVARQRLAQPYTLPMFV